MKWLIVEDESGQIANWLFVLAEKNVSGARNLGQLNWTKILEYSKQTYSAEPPTEPVPLNEFCSAITKDSRLFGAKSGDILVLCVMTHKASNDVNEWLAEKLPSSCLSFLDYVLAGDQDAKLAEAIAPNLARSHSQLCVNHSSKIGDMDCPDNLGLPVAQLPFYKVSTRRLITVEATRVCIADAYKFWQSHNRSFTGDKDVDKMINLFIRGKEGQWDIPNGPFHHDEIQNAGSVSSNEIAALGFITSDDDSRKGLFQCASGVLRDKPGKKVLPSDLTVALQSLGLRDVSLHVTNEARWKPPFLPGILFLCHLKLMMTAYSDKKDDRQPPALHIYPKSVEFIFKSSVEQGFGEWRQGSGNSCKRMLAAEKGWLGETDAIWVAGTAANSIHTLLQPEVTPRLVVSVSAMKVTVSWD